MTDGGTVDALQQFRHILDQRKEAVKLDSWLRPLTGAVAAPRLPRRELSGGLVIESVEPLAQE